MPSEEDPEPYSVFTRAEKWCIVGMVVYAAWFSTLSSFIYFPTIQTLSEAFDATVDKINLSNTCYMVVAIHAPMLVGDVADVQGRRLVYVAVLSLYVGVNIALELTKSYGAHLGLRVVQALTISRRSPGI